MRRRICLCLCLVFIGCASAPIQSVNGKLQIPPDIQDNWNEKMCWQFASPIGRGVAIGGIVSGSALFTLAGGAVDMANTNNICDLTPNEMLPFAYLKLSTKTENSLIVERTDASYVPMNSPRFDVSRYYVLPDGTIGVKLVVWERLRSNNTERCFEVCNEVKIVDNKVVMVKENVGEEESLSKHRRWITQMAGGGQMSSPVHSSPQNNKLSDEELMKLPPLMRPGR